MTRRFFTSALSAFALDPERLLWVPGAKMISIPAPPKVERITWDIDTWMGKRYIRFYKRGAPFLGEPWRISVEDVTRPEFFTKWPDYAVAILASPAGAWGGWEE